MRGLKGIVWAIEKVVKVLGEFVVVNEEVVGEFDQVVAVLEDILVHVGVIEVVLKGLYWSLRRL